MAAALATQNPSLRQTVKHFSHQHALRPFESKKEDEIICSGCELDIIDSSAYKCTKSSCDYFLHKSCLKLPRELQHTFHACHPLILLSSPAYIGGRFICNACGDYGTGFNYHCSACNYDLHVACSKLPKILKREDHCHPLTLFSSSSCDRGIEKFFCDICNGVVRNTCWVYYCPDCDFGTDICCANAVKVKSRDSSACKCTGSLSMYKSCFKLPQKIQHKSHPDHPLALFSSPAYTSGVFICNACDEKGTGFNYHCCTCSYDLHVACSKMPQTLKLEDHEHPLTLSNSSKFNNFTCDICKGVVPRNRWVYYCTSECKYGVDIRCITAVAGHQFCPRKEEESRKKPCDIQELTKYSLSQVKNQLRMLQVQNESSFQTATKLISDMKGNLANLIN